MEVKREPDRCRLCFTHVMQYISLFENTALVSDIINRLKQYFDDELSDSDVLPKVICIDCWNKVDAFCKFCEQVIAQREEYLHKYFNNTVKDEANEEFGMSNIEPEIHREMVCVDPLRPIKMVIEEENESMELEESKLDYAATNEQGFSNGNECDDDNQANDGFFDGDELSESQNGSQLPRHISEVSREQQQQIISQYFDMSCDFCETTFRTFQDVIRHYKMKHKNQPRGYVKCCSIKWSQNSHFNSHIVYHLNPEVYKCQICSDVKKSYVSYANHKQTHFNQFTCDICQKIFTVYKSLERHILEVHAAKLKFPCNQCNQSFKNRKHLKIHLEVTHSIDLEDYINEIKTLDFDISKVQVNRIMEEYFDRKCDQCDAVLDSFSMAKSHYSSEHDIRTAYMKCCGIKMHNNSLVLDHIQWHINSEIFSCRVCKLNHKHRYTLIDHVKRHRALSSKQFACSICDRYYATSTQLRNHTELEHPGMPLSLHSIETKSNEKKGDLTSDAEIPNFVGASCDLCPAKPFTTFKEMQSHYLEMHKLAGWVSCCNKKYNQLSRFSDHIAWHNDSNAFRCNVCFKSLPNRYILKQHNDWHSNKYYCQKCEKSFPRRNQFRDHLETHNNRKREKQRNFFCDVCQKGFSNRSQMNSHRKRHDLDYDQICEFCAKKFKTKAELKHHQTKHLEVESKTNPKFQCDICKVWYSSRGNLKVHQMKHDSEPKKCNHCQKVCPNSSALDQHVRRNHSGMSFNCHLCEKTFKSQVTLKDHVATHMNKKCYKCTYCDESFIWKPNMYKHRKQMHEAEWLADKAKTEESKMKP